MHTHRRIAVAPSVGLQIAQIAYTRHANRFAWLVARCIVHAFCTGECAIAKGAEWCFRIAARMAIQVAQFTTPGDALGLVGFGAIAILGTLDTGRSVAAVNTETRGRLAAYIGPYLTDDTGPL